MTDNKDKGTKKRKRGIETKRAILDTAAELFAKNGFDGVSMREIANGTGIKESSIYNHFESKAAILETLFEEFIRLIPGTRPSDEELDKMLVMMNPEELFKAILFYVGKSVHGTLAHTTRIINHEKFRNPRAAEMYYKYLVNEPASYYERLICKMIERQKIKPVDARIMAEQYNYISIALTDEYIMSQNGLADEYSVVKYMITTLHFFCHLMKEDVGRYDGKKDEI